MNPSINVNLKCGCNHIQNHWPGCVGPILLPCPIPRSVTFEVRLGECHRIVGALTSCGAGSHHRDCPAVPIRVTCSIWGKTWEESAPVDLEFDPVPSDVGGTAARVLLIVRERWAQVKALVLGQPAPDPLSLAGRMVILDFYKQRDTVFAALADMARAEEAALKAQERDDAAFPYHRFHRVGGGDHRGPRPSHARLEAFVEHLVEQVGRLQEAA